MITVIVKKEPKTPESLPLHVKKELFKELDQINRKTLKSCILNHFQDKLATYAEA